MLGTIAFLLLGGAFPGDGPRSARAAEPMVEYIGMHPLSPHQGDFCYIDAVHYHRVVPVDLRVYVTLGAEKGRAGHLYVGDPAWLGYDGPKVAYFGPHPLQVPLVPDAGPLFCYITGAHYHATAPAPSATMILKDGVYWYMGALPPVEVQRSWINEVHAIKRYVAPKVGVEMAPPGYHVFSVGADLRSAAAVPPQAPPAPTRPPKAPPAAGRPR